MNVYHASGKAIRLSRLLEGPRQTSLMVAYSHGLYRGPARGLATPEEMQRLCQIYREERISAVLVSPGMLRYLAPAFFGKQAPSVVLGIDWNNMHREPEELGFPRGTGRSALAASVETAVALGADAVHTYLFLGSGDPTVEADEVRRNAEVQEACDHLGIVHLVEPMVRGDRIRSTTDPVYVRLVSRIASEIGADILKVEWTGSADSFRMVCEATPVPVLMAGGDPREDPKGFLATMESAMQAGARGGVIGRNIFQAANPAAVVRALRQIVIDGATAAAAGRELGA